MGRILNFLEEWKQSVKFRQKWLRFSKNGDEHVKLLSIFFRYGETLIRIRDENLLNYCGRRGAKDVHFFFRLRCVDAVWLFFSSPIHWFSFGWRFSWFPDWIQKMRRIVRRTHVNMIGLVKSFPTGSPFQRASASIQPRTSPWKSRGT